MSKHLISPSILTADFLHLEKEIEMVNSSEADLLHLDIMDGVFVPNLTFGFPDDPADKISGQKTPGCTPDDYGSRPLPGSIPGCGSRLADCALRNLYPPAPNHPEDQGTGNETGRIAQSPYRCIPAGKCSGRSEYGAGDDGKSGFRGTKIH